MDSDELIPLFIKAHTVAYHKVIALIYTVI